jgi:hypothetical protein
MRVNLLWMITIWCVYESIVLQYIKLTFKIHGVAGFLSLTLMLVLSFSGGTHNLGTDSIPALSIAIVAISISSSLIVLVSCWIQKRQRESI